MVDILDTKMPGFWLDATGSGGSIPATPDNAERLCVALEFKRLAITQYSNFNFESLAVFNGVLIGATIDGLYSLLDADDDDGTDIDAIFETITTDFGVPSKKKLRRAYIAGEASGNITFKFKTDDGDYEEYTLTPAQLSQLQHRCRLNLKHIQKGNYWMLRVENADGCDFSIDSVDLLTIIMGLGR